MKIYLANPLYDAVFKYLMDDERICKTILSALLKKEVLQVEMRRHEYPNIARDTISMFRVDFAAKVQEPDGSQRLILIELQKTWLETETLRFRQYLAVQYNNKENMIKDTNGKYALPTVAVYMLGHKVGNIKEPVVYVEHNTYDYNGNIVTEGVPDPFVESLQHNSIIVQIPLLRGHVNNRLDKILSVFDQTNITPDDTRTIALDEAEFADDAEMQRILHRLQAAASNPEIRNRMNAEDEFFKALEDRDTAIMQREKELKEKDTQIKEKDTQIKEKDTQIKEKDTQIKEKDTQIKEKDTQIKEKDTQIKEQRLTLRKIVLAMLENGMTKEAIAEMMGKSIDEISQICEE